MRHLFLACVAALATGAHAGGLDLSGQPVTLLFRDGDYAELSLGAVAPHVVGADAAGASSGSVFGTVSDIGLGIVRALGDRWTAAVILDRPWAVRLRYDDADAAFPFAGTGAEAESVEVTGLVRYRLDRRWSVHGGLRAGRFGGEALLDGAGYGPLAGYRWTGAPDWGLGYVVGAAFEVPEVALRVALTYGSAIRYELAARETGFGTSTTPVTMPQSVNLDFQAGIAPGTLAYGLVRWVGWDGWTIAPQGLAAATGLPLVTFDSDAFTWRVGVARQITPRFGAAIEVTHETPRNRAMTALDPYDGFTALAVGGQWRHPSGIEIGAGVGYGWLGAATAMLPSGASADFAGNHALSGRLRLGVSF